jgi:hypothetical protein
MDHCPPPWRAHWEVLPTRVIVLRPEDGKLVRQYQSITIRTRTT